MDAEWIAGEARTAMQKAASDCELTARRFKECKEACAVADTAKSEANAVFEQMKDE